MYGEKDIRENVKTNDSFLEYFYICNYKRVKQDSNKSNHEHLRINQDDYTKNM